MSIVSETPNETAPRIVAVIRADSLAQLESKIDAAVSAGHAAFAAIGGALLEIRRDQLVQNFDTYVEERFGFSSRHANRMVQAAETVGALGPIGHEVKTESQARELSGLSEVEAMEVVKTALQDGALTAAKIRVTREELAPRNVIVHTEVTEGQLRVITRKRSPFSGDVQRALSDLAKVTKRLHELTTDNRWKRNVAQRDGWDRADLDRAIKTLTEVSDEMGGGHNV